MYLDKLFPFLKDGDFIRSKREMIDTRDIYCPLDADLSVVNIDLKNNKKFFKLIRVMPCNVLVVNESDEVALKLKNGIYGNPIKAIISEIDYSPIASRVEVETVDDVMSATLNLGGSYQKEEVVTDVLVSMACNGIEVDTNELDNIHVPYESGISFADWMNTTKDINESADFLDSLIADKQNGKNIKGTILGESKDSIYDWLDSYFALPEEADMKSGGREVVPLLIGPTAVFKSATVKELCAKYHYRMVDFRVAFTSRLDYSGLFQIGEVDGKKFSYSCPMEELVTCSDGFRAFCRKAHEKVSKILKDGFIEDNKVSDGENSDSNQVQLTSEQIAKLNKLLQNYEYYMQTPVLFFDEITRCFSGDTRVRLLDGRILTMKEIHEEFGTDKPFYVYSCDEKGNVRFTEAYSLGVTRKNAQMIKVTLDNGAEVICTPDHRWMLRDGSYEQAQYFETGRSLMGTYFGEYSSTDTGWGSVYETYINPADGVERFTHREVARQFDKSWRYGTISPDGFYYNAHHRDFNSRNNVPENLEIMSRVDHFNLHAHGENSVSVRLKSLPGYEDMQRQCFDKARQNPDFMKNQMEALKRVRSTEEYRKKRSSISKDALGSEENRARQSAVCKKQWESGQFDNIDRQDSNRKMQLEKVRIFIKVLLDKGYNVTPKNYDRFVSNFTGRHGIYYQVMRCEAINNNNGVSVKSLISEVKNRDWESDYMHKMDDLNKRAEKVVYNPEVQRIIDHPIGHKLRNYSDIDFGNAHVQKTLSWLNMLGDISDEEYLEYFNKRDKSEWQNVFKLQRVYERFGSLKRAIEISKVYNHKVVKIEWLEETEDAYDISVPKYHNFLIDLGDNSGVFVHNCKDAGVNGVLVQLLNQKRFNDMTLNGCKFVAATNLNINNDPAHAEHKDELDDMYDVQEEIDVAYANRFMPLLVRPKDVEGRWFEWAESTKEKNGKTVTSIHQVILDFLRGPGKNMVYNDQPVLDAIERGLSDNEKRSQTFPNYRTWDMLSDYMYSIDEDYELRLKEDSEAKREYRRNIIVGLISEWAGNEFISFIRDRGYYEYDSVHGKVVDDVGDFLSSTLSSGVPALLIGPSSLGKTSRVHAYMKDVERRTGLKPILINVNLASCDTTDMMGYPIKQSLVEYSSGKDLETMGLGSVQRDLQDVMKGIQSNMDYGMTDSVTLRAPDMRMKERFKRALDEGREVILFFDEANRVKNPTIMSALFECISDSRFCNVSFKAQKDKVKIVAACNMSYSDMDSIEDVESDAYSGAGSLDPALAARFSMFWKKGYDENDVKSWIAFMEDQKKEGNIDSTLVDYFKTLSTDEAIRTMARVEARTLESAEPSTRTFFQMSKDIKSMRGKASKDGYRKSLYNGKVIFDDMISQEYVKVFTDMDNQNLGDTYIIQEVVDFLKKVTEYRDNWEASITGEKIDVGNGRVLSGEDIMDTLDKIIEFLDDKLQRPLTKDDVELCKTYYSTAMDLVSSVQRMDQRTSDKRKDWFAMYVGEDFARSFVSYFNSVYGTEMDEDITIEMLSDTSLINPFLRKKRAELSKLSGNTDKMIDEMLDLMREFLAVHGTTLPSKNYAMFIDGIRNVLPVADNMSTLLIRSDKTVEDMFMKGEEEGDSWIKGIVSCYSANISDKDIEDMKAKMSSIKSSKSSGRRSRIL